jgi:general secretion pathway protein C
MKIMPKRYHTVFNLVALSIIIYIGVDTFYTVVRAKLRHQDVKISVAPKIPDVKRQPKLPYTHYQAIMGRNLFGSTDAIAQEVKEEDIEALEPTTLKVALLGTVSGASQNTYAVIEETNKRKQGLFKVGDSIQGAVIRSIQRGVVLLKVGENLEKLTMEEAAAAKSTETKKGRATPRASRSPRVTPGATGTNVTVSRSDVEASLKDINQLLTQARVRPHFQDGEPDGLAISRIKKGSFFSKLGLRDGDVVRAIDNSEIRSPDDILALYNKLKSGSVVGIEINRKGQQQTINYTFR